MAPPEDLIRLSNVIWELPKTHKPGMRVPARIVGISGLIEIMDDGVFDQISNVAMLPGIVECAWCMADGHLGYGFPIGGVAAVDAADGVISPGGIGFDINCGMRLLATNLTYAEVKPLLPALVDRLFRRIPSGMGGSGPLSITRQEFRRVLQEGARWCIDRGFGWREDLDRTEEGGAMRSANPDKVSERAVERGLHQLGTLGSGNHYLEVQVAREENIVDSGRARIFGISEPDQVMVMFHCGSRGFGHQVATDYLRRFLEVMEGRYGIRLPDRELACAPIDSPEGRDYFEAMQCAANMAFANRQLIAHRVREAFSEVFGRDTYELGMHQVYDVSHNTAKLEEHMVRSEKRMLLVHRKGSTRSFGPRMPDLPCRYRETGQPVIVGGSMESGSYLLAGESGGESAFFSTAHGSGRVMSRTRARHLFDGRTLQRRMAEKGIVSRTASFSGFAEEAGAAYKDIDAVVESVEKAGFSSRVAKLIPIGNIKG